LRRRYKFKVIFKMSQIFNKSTRTTKDFKEYKRAQKPKEPQIDPGLNQDLLWVGLIGVGAPLDYAYCVGSKNNKGFYDKVSRNPYESKPN